jgi:hypothetical protein
MNDFSEAARTERRVSDQPAATIDGITFLLLDDDAIARRLELAVRVRLHRLIVQIDAQCFVRAIGSRAFFGSSLPFIVIPQTVEILGSSCFKDCRSLSSISIESA